MWRVGHDKIRHIAHNAIFEYICRIRMLEHGDTLHPVKERAPFLVHQVQQKHLDGAQRPGLRLLGQIDLTRAPPSQRAQQPVVANHSPRQARPTPAFPLGPDSPVHNDTPLLRLQSSDSPLSPCVFLFSLYY